MDAQLKEIKEKLIAYQEVAKKERETDSKRESKELTDKLYEMAEEIDDLFDSYIDAIVPEEVNLKVEVNKIVSVDTWTAVDNLRGSIYDMDPDELDTLNVKDKVIDYITTDIEPDDFLYPMDFKISVDD